MKKRVLCSIILLILILLSSCTDSESIIGEMKVLTPNSSNRINDPYIVENLDYTRHIQIESADQKRYKFSPISKIYNSQHLEALIKGEFEGYSAYIVKKVGVKSYGFDVINYNPLNITKCAFSVAELEVKAVVYNGEDTKREKGSSIFVSENYGMDNKGTFLYNTSPSLYYYSGENKIHIYNGDYLKNDTYYLLILQNKDKINNTESDGVYAYHRDAYKSDVVYDSQNAFKDFPHLDYDYYEYVELSKYTYDQALNIQSDSNVCLDSVIGYTQMVLYAFENYGNVLPSVKEEYNIVQIILYTIIAVESVALIIILIRMGMRKKPPTPAAPPQEDLQQNETTSPPKEE